MGSLSRTWIAPSILLKPPTCCNCRKAEALLTVLRVCPGTSRQDRIDQGVCSCRVEVVRRLGVGAGVAALVLLGVALAPSSSRAFTGNITLAGCVELDQGDGCTTLVAEPPFANSITVTADGRDIYVLVDGTIYDAEPQADGTSAVARCYSQAASSGCASLPMLDGDVEQLVVSPDGALAYVATSRQTSFASPESIVVLRRDPATGALSQLQCLGDASTAACPTPGASHLVSGTRLALSPDGRFVDVAGGVVNSLSVTASYRRAADGTLSEVSCLASQPLGGCSTSPALSYTRRVAESPDGAHVYDAGASSVTTLVRDGSGALRMAGCVTADASTDPSCTPIGSLAQTVDDLVLAPDGTIAYASSGATIWHLAVQPNGSLAASGCDLPSYPSYLCEPSSELYAQLAIAPDAQTLYTATGGEVPLGPVYGSYFGPGIDVVGGSAVAATNDHVYIFASGGLFTFSRDRASAPASTTTTAPPVTPLPGLSPAAPRTTTRARVVVRSVTATLLRPRGRALAVTFRCPAARCAGTVGLLRDGHVTVSHRFAAGRGGRVRVTFSLTARSWRGTKARLRIRASAPGRVTRTVLESVLVAHRR